jgi:hypothetical protein
MADCPICLVQAETTKEVDAVRYRCINHNEFRVADTVFAIEGLMRRPSDDWEAALKKARVDAAGMRTITTYSFE